MAIRYLVIQSAGEVGSSVERSHIETATNLVWVGRVASFDIFASSKTVCTEFAHDAGIVIGNLFESRSPPARTGSLDLTKNDGLHSRLLRAYWGGYVGFSSGPDHSSLHVLRDPSGVMPCYYVKVTDGLALASDVETLSLAGLLKSEVDWGYLAYHLFSLDLRTARTALASVEELLPGFELVSSQEGVQTKCAWNPWDFVRPAHATSELVADLRETVASCVKAWAGSFTRILAPVSGGLDSSIIAACLLDQPTAWDCMTMATDEPEGDERYYARILAESFGKPLTEAFHTLADIDVTRTVSGHLPRPNSYAFAQSEERIKRMLAAERNSDAFFTGHGGDNVFCFLQSATPLVDRILAEGLGAGAWRTLNDICTLTGCSLFEAMGMAGQRLLKGAAYPWAGDPSFLNPEAISLGGSKLTHPWLEAPVGALPGKAVHIATLLRIHGSLEGWSRLNWGPLIAPLISQPIVELCLTIPTWMWCENGINRAVARQAFARDIPVELLERRWKGGPNSFCLDVLAAHRETMRAFLLDGLLAKQGILDTDAVEAAFAQPGPIGPPHHLRLSALAEAEAWARHWHS